MLAIFIFMAACLALAAFLVVSSMRTSREEQRELARAREREQAARRDAELARQTRARWEAKIAADTAEIEIHAARLPPADGESSATRRGTGRFTRDVPAPFSS